MMKIRKLYITFFLLFGITVLYAQSWTQIGNAINGDAEWDKSGFKVSLSGDGTVVAVSAIEHDRDGFNSSDNAGQVKVFKNDNGTWKQLGEDICGERGSENLGQSLGLNYDGTVLAVGTPQYKNDDQTISGHVKIFKNNNGKWIQTGKDINGGNLEKFGNSLDLNSDGSIIAIGSGLGSYGVFNGVKVYKNISGTWEKLGNDLPGGQDGLGFSVSLNAKGDILAMGGIEDFNMMGHVKIYQYFEDDNLWKIIGKRIDGKNPIDSSGWSVSLNSDGNIIAIGAPGNDDNGESSGQTRIFKNISGTWSQIGNDINGEYHKGSGRSVSLSADGSIIAIGSSVTDGYNTEKDHVSIYKYKNGVWNLLGEKINESEAYSWFGESVSLNDDGTTVAVGAFSSNANGEHSGQTRIYTYSGSLGLEDLSLTNTTVYPNPTTGYLAVNSKISISQLQIYNTLGQLIMTKKNRKDINISTLEQGLYFLKVQDVNGNYTSRKIIKK